MAAGLAEVEMLGSGLGVSRLTAGAKLTDIFQSQKGGGGAGEARKKEEEEGERGGGGA